MMLWLGGVPCWDVVEPSSVVSDDRAPCATTNTYDGTLLSIRASLLEMSRKPAASLSVMKLMIAGVDPCGSAEPSLTSSPLVFHP